LEIKKEAQEGEVDMKKINRFPNCCGRAEYAIKLQPCKPIEDITVKGKVCNPKPYICCHHEHNENNENVDNELIIKLILLLLVCKFLYGISHTPKACCACYCC